MARLTADQAQGLIDAAEDQQVMYMAIHMAAAANRMYSDGDCCPLCGYDAYWNCDSAQESVLETYRMLSTALTAGPDNGYADLKTDG